MVSPEVVRQLDLKIFEGPFQLNYSISILFLNLCLILQSHVTWARSSQKPTSILQIEAEVNKSIFPWLFFLIWKATGQKSLLAKISDPTYVNVWLQCQLEPPGSVIVQAWAKEQQLLRGKHRHVLRLANLFKHCFWVSK